MDFAEFNHRLTIPALIGLAVSTRISKADIH
jgi:hypothetical protein